ncbi:hypothetical protein ACJMK2_039750 [Sinanodonta woodiana]|uniref:Integrator complex subunit 5 n=1 Tax=Sinanodonta woodiana TaxID=1069815 RepID=A0ABD3WCY5_SINWO
MATASESLSKTLGPQDLLNEVRSFVQGVTYKGKVKNESLVQSALLLLKTLPAARHAVLEHLANVFGEAVNMHLMNLEFGRNSLDQGGEEDLETVLKDASGVLHTFIHSHPQAWAPIISTWSFELLGHISCKYSDRRGVPHPGSLNELLQLWMTCTPTKLLIEVTTECFAAMVGGAPDACVDALLEASVKYSPHFDWVVAHIGSCFPTTIITRVLMCGLKDFCHHGRQQGHMDSSSGQEEKIPKMTSVVGILGHLAAKHSQDIRMAFMRLFEESLKAESEAVRFTTIPFLLQLASMSPLLLQIMTTDTLKALNAPVLNKLHYQFSQWKASCPLEYESFLTLVVHLLMKSDVGAFQALQFLMNNATASQSAETDPNLVPVVEVQRTCAILVDQLLRELELMVFCKYKVSNSEIPFLSSICPRASELAEMMLHAEEPRIGWLMRLVCCTVMYGGEESGAEILSLILSQAQTPQQLGQFVAVQSLIEVSLPRVLTGLSQAVMDELQPNKQTDKLQLMNNLLELLDWEQKSDKANNRSQLRNCFQSHWDALCQLLLHSNIMVAIATLKVLNIIGRPKRLTSTSVLHACGMVLSLFFRILEFQDDKEVSGLVNECKKCTKQLAQEGLAQSILVHFLLEGVLSEENKALFGGKINAFINKDESKYLAEENKSHGTALTLLRSHSSVFHAGVIGQGLRTPVSRLNLGKEIITRNKKLFLELLWLSSREQRVENLESDVTMDTTDESHSNKTLYVLRVPADLCRQIGSLIVELTTPDVLYNNRFWPEEETLKMTVERDLLVWKVLDDNPVLWDIFQMYAGNSLIMCRCSPVLRSLTATLINHFDSARERLAQNYPKHVECTCILIRCLAKSHLLPHPMGLTSELFPIVTSFEAYLLLLTIWRYMKENPPTEDPEEISRRICDQRHLEPVRAILHNNIEHAGNLYSRFFPPVRPQMM